MCVCVCVCVCEIIKDMTVVNIRMNYRGQVYFLASLVLFMRFFKKN